MQSIEDKIVSRIYGNGRGWSFSQKDFMDIGGRSPVDNALVNLCNKGTIRRVIRGLYDYPKYSELLEQQISPDLDQVARALARKFGWRIQPGGAAALNILGLSTQVPAKVTYLSDGPDKKYEIGNTTLYFENTALKDSGFKLTESSLVVQALKTLGQEHITDDTVQKIRLLFTPELRRKILKDTRTTAGWISDIILKICKEDGNG